MHDFRSTEWWGKLNQRYALSPTRFDVIEIRATAAREIVDTLRDLQDAVNEYVFASVFEADESAAEGADCLFGPRSQAAKSRLNLAYERLYSLSSYGRKVEEMERPRYEPCSACRGTGDWYDHAGRTPCFSCDGSGEVKS